jgi:hypothetical protein
MIRQDDPAGPPRRGVRPGRHNPHSVRALFVVIGSLMVAACLVGAFMAAGLTK